MAAIAENFASSDVTENINQPTFSELSEEDLNSKDGNAEEDLSSRDGNAEDTEGEGDEVDGEIVSDIEIILPKEVIESCVSLKAGGESSFWSVNKEAQTSSQLTLHKRDDESVKIRVTVVVMGENATTSHNSDYIDNKSSNIEGIEFENGVSETLNSSASKEKLQICKSIGNAPSLEMAENSAVESSKAITTDNGDTTKELNPNLLVVESCEMAKLGSTVPQDRGDGISSTEHSDLNGNTEAAKTKSLIESSNNSSPVPSSDIDSAMAASGTTVIIVKHVNRNQSTRDMDTQTDSEISSVAVETGYTNLPSIAVRTITGSVNTTAATTAVISVSAKPVSASSAESNGVTVVSNSRDIAERLKAREAMRKATEIKQPPQQQAIRCVPKVFSGKVQSISRVVPSTAVAVVQDCMSVCENNDVFKSISTVESESNPAEQKARVASTATTDTQKSSVVSGPTSEGGKLSCDLCGDISDGGYIALIRHVKRKHTDCTFVRTYIDELRALQAEAHKCPVCRKGFPTGGALSAHIRACHGSIEWMRAVGGTGGNISSSSNVKNVDSGSTVKTTDNKVKNVSSSSQAKSDQTSSKDAEEKIVESSKKSKSMVSQLAKKTAVDNKNQKLAARSNLAKKVEQAMAAKANAISSKNNLRGKRKLPETVAESVTNKKAKVNKKTTEPATKKGTAKTPASGSGKQQTMAGRAQEKGTDVQNTPGKEDNEEKGKKATQRQPPRRFVCDLCSQVFTTTTVLATHMRYCKTDRGSV